MKIDIYTKSILTVIAIVMISLFVDNLTKPVNAQFNAGNEIIINDSKMRGIYHLKNGKIRYCVGFTDIKFKPYETVCSDWDTIK